MNSDLIIKDAQPPDLDWDRTSELVILPASVAGDSGVYPYDAGEVATQLGDAGLSVSYVHDPDRRLWSADRGWEDVVISVLVWAGSSAAWDALKLLFAKRSGRTRLSIGYRRGPGTEERWLTMEGDSAAIAATLRDIDPWRPNGS